MNIEDVTGDSQASAHGQTETAVDGSRCYRIEQKKKRQGGYLCVQICSRVYIK
jgi:hypothetical protein